MTLQSGASLLQTRTDLRIHAAVLFAIALAALVWAALPRQETADA